MDDRRFDALTRALARGASRRTALKGLIAGLVGGAAITTRLDHAGAQLVSCDTDADCSQPDSCTLAFCDEGFCSVDSACPSGEFCCPAQGGSCAECCDDGDCPSNEPICYNPGDPSNAYCVQCVDASDCAQPDACTLSTCTNNICGTASACPAGETCCDVDGVGIDCVNLTAPNDQYCGACGVVCGPCESCESGQCVPYAKYCPETDQCYQTSIGECCYDNECGGGFCIDGLCRPCRDDSHCLDCWVCDQSNNCSPLICESGETCCEGHACVPEDECCREIGDYCGLEISAAGGDSSQQYDCCDGLVCCENWNSQGSVCAECCNDWDCPHGAHCNEGWCEWPDYCDHDKDCPKGTCCCKDGSCSGKCCDKPHPPKPPKPPKPAPSDEPVTSLPATGAGPNDERNSLLGVTALGAAAAILAAKKLRETPEA